MINQLIFQISYRIERLNSLYPLMKFVESNLLDLEHWILYNDPTTDIVILLHGLFFTV